MSTIALPRVIRKRLKPPPPSLWWALFWVMFDFVFAVYDVSVVLTAPSVAIRVIATVACAVMVTSLSVPRIGTWAKFVRELDAWKDDQ